MSECLSIHIEDATPSVYCLMSVSRTTGVDIHVHLQLLSMPNINLSQANSISFARLDFESGVRHPTMWPGVPGQISYRAVVPRSDPIFELGN